MSGGEHFYGAARDRELNEAIMERYNEEIKTHANHNSVIVYVVASDRRGMLLADKCLKCGVIISAVEVRFEIYHGLAHLLIDEMNFAKEQEKLR
jgi:hypothetical protein